jgi:hypothetical protein
MRLLILSVVCVFCIAVAHGQTTLTGRWEGSTNLGRQVVLDVKASGEQLTGTFVLDKQSAEIRDGKTSGKTFSFAVNLGGRTASFTGEAMDDSMQVTPQGGAAPVALKRVK